MFSQKASWWIVPIRYFALLVSEAINNYDLKTISTLSMQADIVFPNLGRFWSLKQNHILQSVHYIIGTHVDPYSEPE